MARRILWAHLVLTGVAVVAMLTWGVYAVLWTFPNDQGSIINAVLERASWRTCCMNSTATTPGSETQYILNVRSQAPANLGVGSILLPGGRGYAFGPIVPAPYDSTISSFKTEYGVFTFNFCPKGTGSCSLGFGYPNPNEGATNAWLSGPQGNISQFMITLKHDPLLEGIARSPLFTVIIEIPTAGNYTLHYHNYFSTNATGTVAMAFSSVVFSRPYFYPGLTTIAIAVGLSVVTVISQMRKVRPRHVKE